uniref:Uncharacterized protein n=1 Tax=Pyramimonas obovata TaxID=1411642 RepID=A0A7S0REU1_9CHLO|mmetsp:Transcript_32516/g.71068  ORF Transcript_32516/g.71068 Transcript_32516/m.71068 type:complete len:459 (+) Transcript_32516:273-1649(+)|eukprot:CAMPEP_0118959126 /NCGR_PEP_ID=MMETSP1169-20130426/62968_1 /TAXON_ID=36882 /ORGANISM="Pyramimonas obovata, Strain CCMP722" /LENGTH=458 /DNA_ID=CAMNT_0006907253 /DNA_START=224 /DNA_END=1600 /DNA_ORIENTATION=-
MKSLCVKLLLFGLPLVLAAADDTTKALTDEIANLKGAKSNLEEQLAVTLQEAAAKRQEAQTLEQDKKGLEEKVLAFERERVKAEFGQQAAQTKVEQLTAESESLHAKHLAEAETAQQMLSHTQTLVKEREAALAAAAKEAAAAAAMADKARQEAAISAAKDKEAALAAVMKTASKDAEEVRRLAGELADQQRMFAEERRQLLAEAEELRQQADPLTWVRIRAAAAWEAAESEIRRAAEAMNQTDTAQLRRLLASAQAAVYEGAGPAWDAAKKGAGDLIAAAEPHLETATKHASGTLSKVAEVSTEGIKQVQEATAPALAGLKEGLKQHTAGLAASLETKLQSAEVQAAHKAFHQKLDEIVALTVAVLSQFELSKPYATPLHAERLVQAMLLLPLLLLPLLCCCACKGKRSRPSYPHHEDFHAFSAAGGPSSSAGGARRRKGSGVKTVTGPDGQRIRMP